MSNLAQNKKAYFNYEILDRFEAGLVLLGFEVKAIRSSRISLDGSYIKLNRLKKSIQLTGASITPLQLENIPKDYEKRNINLLIKKRLFNELIVSVEEKRLTLIPLNIYDKNGLIKIEIALAKGKKKFDKRETLKKRDSDREIRRAMKGF